MKVSGFAAALLALGVAAACAHAETTSIVVRTVTGSFEDFKDRVALAVEARGMVINYTARIGDMLRRTGKDIGRGKPVYADAQMLEFCSARLSRDAMEADVRNIVYCPYGIAVYSLPAEPGKVYIAYRKLGPLASGASGKALGAVDRMLEEIVNEAVK